MGKCNIDHSIEDVLNKLKAQSEYLPENFPDEIREYVERAPSQEELNEVFHLLKKYDLATYEEQEVRKTKLRALLK
ncbi:group-specific protein [Pseudalkalibacillus caeni]|uniref:Group-specific protein n=1 Tax=Exobacillus caeni TaxID=2574798 RepID=A0A5R9F7B2_9BACL|nr:group-specific protein [Pseudalkalibacillus caeni]TLS37518.1 group-specific protein [Pseudalkalibacillus caeni]